MFHPIQELSAPIAALPDVIRDSAATLKAYFDKDPTQLMEAHNELIQDLSSHSAGDSGAAYIGSEAISGVKGTTVYTQLTDLKRQMDQIVVGSLPAQTVTAEALAPGAALGNLEQESLTKEYLAQAVQQLLFSPGDLKWRASAQAPAGWLLCDGSAYSKTEYAQLYGVIGDYFTGEGIPETQFCVPDLRGRVPVGVDDTINEFNVLGKVGGEIAHTLTVEEMPAHNHQQIFSQTATKVMVNGIGRSPMSDNMDSTLNASSIASRGGSKEHNNLQPYVTMYCFIKW